MFESWRLYNVESCSEYGMFYLDQTINVNKKYKIILQPLKIRCQRGQMWPTLVEHNHCIYYIDDNVGILKICSKGKSMNAWE